MSGPLDLEALRQWAEKRDIPYGSEMVKLFPRLADDLIFACEKLELALAALRQYDDARNWGIERDDFRHPRAVWIGPGSDARPAPDAPGIARSAIEELA